MNKNITILILAAGASSRMGEAKQLLPWRDTTLLGNAISTAKTSRANEVLIVLGANADTIKAEVISKNITFLENKLLNLGLGSSISCGINFIMSNRKQPDGVLIMLSDQPLIDAPYLNCLIDTFTEEKKGIVGTSYGTRVGVPVIFGSKYFAELQKLYEDFGARDIILKNLSDCMSLKTDGKEFDIDTKEDYRTLLGRLK